MKNLTELELQQKARKFAMTNIFSSINEGDLESLGLCLDDFPNPTITEQDCEYPNDILELYNISEKLYKKLLNQKERVVKHPKLHLFIWGRTCSGQAVYIDYCIRKAAIALKK